MRKYVFAVILAFVAGVFVAYFKDEVHKTDAATQQVAETQRNGLLTPTGGTYMVRLDDDGMSAMIRLNEPGAVEHPYAVKTSTDGSALTFLPRRNGDPGFVTTSRPPQTFMTGVKSTLLLLDLTKG